MRTLLRQLHSILRAAVLGLRHNAAAHSLSVGVIALSLTTLGAFGVVALNLSRVAQSWERDLSVIAFLLPDAGDAAAEGLRQRAGRMPDAARATLVTRDMARERLSIALGQRAQLLSGLEQRIIPAAIEVDLKPGATRQSSAAVAAELARDPAVEEVSWGEEELSRLGAVIGLLDLAALVMGALIAIVTVLVISSTLRLTVMARREEIEILKLVGAGDLYVRAPFLLEGAAQGAAGALLAIGLLEGAQQLAALRVEQILRAAFGDVSLGAIPLEALGWLLLAGTVLGVLGGLLGVTRFLRV